MIAAVRGRDSFVALQRHGKSAYAGAFKVTSLADVTDIPRLAFAIDRSVGIAVVRNRLRRRLRVVFADLVVERDDLVQPGDYLLRVRESKFSNTEARQWLVTALEKLSVES